VGKRADEMRMAMDIDVAGQDTSERTKQAIKNKRQTPAYESSVPLKKRRFQSPTGIYVNYLIIAVGENVLKVLLNIHTFLERVGIELLKRLEPSIMILLMTTIGSNHAATFN
jgi:hypothetical protein